MTVSRVLTKARRAAAIAVVMVFAASIDGSAQEAQPSHAEGAAPAVTEPAIQPSKEMQPAAPIAAAPAPQDAVATAVAGDLSLPHDLSPWGMFQNADIVVKAVMIGLAFASLVTWTVWLAKSLELFLARLATSRALRSVGAAGSLVDASRGLGGKSDASARLINAASQELELSRDALDHAGNDGLKERVASRLSRIEVQAGRRMARGTGVLATIGSTAPFVGLFGTVWGIMNAFIGISEAQTTNLAVVAPGIAEALLATALGLVAAIPAVVIYNVFARSITGYRQALADVSAGVERLVSRDLDFRMLPRPVALSAE